MLLARESDVRSKHSTMRRMSAGIRQEKLNLYLTMEFRRAVKRLWSSIKVRIEGPSQSSQIG